MSVCRASRLSSLRYRLGRSDRRDMLGFLVAGADSRLPAIAYEQQRRSGNAVAVVAA